MRKGQEGTLAAFGAASYRDLTIEELHFLWQFDRNSRTSMACGEELMRRYSAGEIYIMARKPGLNSEVKT
jgi:hypothetical protein